MAFENFKNSYIENQPEIEGIVKTAVDQLLQKEISFEKQVSEQKDLKASVRQLTFPAVTLSFKTGNSTNHLLVMEPGFVNQFYAWMIADEPAEMIGEEQLEGLKEAFDQILGQLKISVADDQASFSADDILVVQAEDGEAASAQLESVAAMFADYSFSVEEKQYKIKFYSWPIPGAQNNVQVGNSVSEQTNSNAVETEAVEKVTVQPAEFGSLSGTGTEQGTGRNVDMLLDVNLEITVELDRKTMLVSDLLKMGKGSIIELEKSAGEPLDIFINSRKFAEGEVVVIDDKFGIRITQLLSPRDRIKSLGI